MTQRYSIRFHDRLFPPTVEVTIPTLLSWTGGVMKVHHEVVLRRYGFSRTHAYRRALRWTRDHGGTR